MERVQQEYFPTKHNPLTVTERASEHAPTPPAHTDHAHGTRVYIYQSMYTVAVPQESMNSQYTALAPLCLRLVHYEDSMKYSDFFTYRTHTLIIYQCACVVCVETQCMYVQ